jgi:hypothetical protein
MPSVFSLYRVFLALGILTHSGSELRYAMMHMNIWVSVP